MSNAFETYNFQVRVQRRGRQVRMLILSSSGLRVRNPDVPWSDSVADALLRLGDDIRATIPGTLYPKED